MAEETDEAHHYSSEKREPRYAGAENTLVW